MVATEAEAARILADLRKLSDSSIVDLAHILVASRARGRPWGEFEEFCMFEFSRRWPGPKAAP